MPLILFALFIGLPILEIYVIIQIGQEIGAIPTVLLLVADAVIGAWLVKREGRRAWEALTQAIQAGQVPGRQLADAALVLVGGTLLLTPGFVTDIFGFFFVLPFTRPFARRLLSVFVARGAVRRFGGPGGTTPRPGRRPGGPGSSGSPDNPGGPHNPGGSRGRPGGDGTASQDGDVHQIYHPDE